MCGYHVFFSQQARVRLGPEHTVNDNARVRRLVIQRGAGGGDREAGMDRWIDVGKDEGMDGRSA